ncbi:MAG TPA: DUF2017 family protein [Gaiellaceae bacterium]|nr:DUF2017 family protein [Gaiellaceae bacterium]
MIRKGRRGEIRVELEPEERILLRRVAGELEALLLAEDGDDPSLRRLYPAAHDDDRLEEEFRTLTRAQLDAGRRQALKTLAETSGQDRLSREEADAWLRALNDARLVLGTRLDITEDFDWETLEGHPRAPELAVYAYLSWIQEQLLDALS